MTAEVIYTGGLHTEATHLRSGNKIATDAPIDNQGKGEAFSPTDLMATALATCILTIMGIAARNHDIPMEGAKAAMNKIMASNPRRISRIEIRIQMPDHAYTEKQKTVLERAAHHCPVAMSLHADLEEVIEFQWPS
ncbi:MAG: OsmC family protein [Bacteroidota bacterium]